TPVTLVFDMHRIQRQMGIVNVAYAANGELILARRRRSRRVLVARQQAVLIFGGTVWVLVANLFRRLVAFQKLRAVVGAQDWTYEAAAANPEVVPGLKVARGPNAPLRIVGEPAVQNRELVEIVGAGCIRSSGNGHADAIAPREHVLSQQPAMRRHVKLGDDVAIIVAGANATKLTPKR